MTGVNGMAPEIAAVHEAERAQRDVADPAASAWVSANAGSGKTRVLTDRVTRLLYEGVSPERILCLTFTKAAAAEMETRLFDQLGRWATLPDDDLAQHLAQFATEEDLAGDFSAARRLFARALETPGGLRIQTIHAFCEDLLKRFPLEAAIAPHFQVMDERTAAELLDDVKERVLSGEVAERDGRSQDALETVIEYVEEFAFESLVDEIAAKRTALTRLFERYPSADDLDARIRSSLGLDEEETEETIVKDACAEEAFGRGRLERACAALDQGGTSDVERAALIRQFLAARERGLVFDDYLQAFLTRELAPRRRLLTKAALAADPEAAEILLNEQDRLRDVVARLASAHVAKATSAALNLARVLLDVFEAEKRHAALVDYDDLILHARRLLQRSDAAPWVLYKLDGGIDHVLVDEAQDTSPDQWEVIAALTDEFFSGLGAHEDRTRTVFAVGDEKQSIYSFQGADPREFDRMRRHFHDRVTAAQSTWRASELLMSFRSAPAILDVVDKVFANPDMRAGITSSPDPVRHVPRRYGHAGLVELWPTEKPSEIELPEPWTAPLDQLPQDAPELRLASRIADTIKGWLDGGEKLAARNREIRPGDVMILVRRRNIFVDEMVRALKQRGVPVAGTDRMVLTDQLAVMDLIALGEFALLPEDDLTLATVLKSPLIGFDEETLFDLAWLPAGRQRDLWATLSARRGDRPEFKAAHGFLADLLERADRIAPYEFYATLLGACHGRRKLTSRLGHEANDPIDEFLSLALQYERLWPPSLQGFLDWLRAGEAEVKRDLEHGRNEVRVMTVHGAKGLEAGIVFLPDTCTAQDGRFDPRLLPYDGKNDDTPERLFLWPVRKALDDPASAAARAAVRDRQAQEYRRLLYVAMTRARDRLYICGYEGARGRSDGCWYDMIAPVFEKEGTPSPLPWGETALRIETPQTVDISDEASDADVVVQPVAPPAWAQCPAPAEPEPSRPLAPSRAVGEEPSVRSPLGPDDQGRFKRGLLIHRLLQTLPDVAPELRQAAALRFLQAPGHGLSAEAIEEIVAETIRVLDDPTFQFVFAPGSRAEVAVAGPVEIDGITTVISGQIDRLAVTEEQILIVDYKTNRPPPRRVEDVPAVYVRQMAAYRAALRSIYPDKSVNCALLWTDGPYLMPLGEAGQDG